MSEQTAEVSTATNQVETATPTETSTLQSVEDRNLLSKIVDNELLKLLDSG